MNKTNFFEFSKNIAQKSLIFLIFFAFVSCSFYETPELPDIDRKSFSYKEVVKKRNALEKRRAAIGVKNESR